MSHPWLEIPIADYEGHMGLASVGQAQLLSNLLLRTVAQVRPRSLAVLGVAGGNGLEAVQGTSVQRLVALDFNPDYLALCTQRFARAFAEFEPVLHDLSAGPPRIAPVECVFAGLLLEYLCVERFCDYLPSLLTEDGALAVVLQLPSPTLPEVSASPYQSLNRLASAIRFVDPQSLHGVLVAGGLARIASEQCNLESGKSFYYACYRLGGKTADENV